ncbi:MAG: hypothetical protein V1659_00600 [Candidatus Woesearchaeota archaeon]
MKMQKKERAKKGDMTTSPIFKIVLGLIALAVLTILLFKAGLFTSDKIKDCTKTVFGNAYCELRDDDCKSGTKRDMGYTCDSYAKSIKKDSKLFKCCMQPNSFTGPVPLERYQKQVEEKLGITSDGQPATQPTPPAQPGTPGQPSASSPIILYVKDSSGAEIRTGQQIPVNPSPAVNSLKLKITGGSRDCSWFVNQEIASNSFSVLYFENPAAFQDDTEKTISLTISPDWWMPIQQNKVKFNFVCFKSGYDKNNWADTTKWEASAAMPLKAACTNAVQSTFGVVPGIESGGAKYFDFYCTDTDLEGCNCNKIYSLITSEEECPAEESLYTVTVASTRREYYSFWDRSVCVFIEDDLGVKQSLLHFPNQDSIKLTLYDSSGLVIYDYGLPDPSVRDSISVREDETINLLADLRGVNAAEALHYGWFIWDETAASGPLAFAEFNTYTDPYNIQFKIKDDILSGLEAGHNLRFYFVVLKPGHPAGNIWLIGESYWAPSASMSVPLTLVP